MDVTDSWHRIHAFVAEPAMAIVGVSRSGKKFGNMAIGELTSRGYRVYPIHPVAADINGVRCYTKVADIPESIAAALVVVPPVQAVGVLRELAAAGVKRVWLQQGAESPEALQAAGEVGIDVVSGECVLMYARPTGFVHNAHRWLWKVLGKLQTAPHEHAVVGALK
jgi:predicted CoA-binding protein